MSNCMAYSPKSNSVAKAFQKCLENYSKRGLNDGAYDGAIYQPALDLSALYQDY